MAHFCHANTKLLHSRISILKSTFLTRPDELEPWNLQLNQHVYSLTGTTEKSGKMQIYKDNITR